MSGPEAPDEQVGAGEVRYQWGDDEVQPGADCEEGQFHIWKEEQGEDHQDECGSLFRPKGARLLQEWAASALPPGPQQIEQGEQGIFAKIHPQLLYFAKAKQALRLSYLQTPEEPKIQGTH